MILKLEIQNSKSEISKLELSGPNRLAVFGPVSDFVIRISDFLAVILCLTCISTVDAQPTPHIGYVYPAGGERGDTYFVNVG